MTTFFHNSHTLIRSLSLFVLIMLFSGCGFQLRGTVSGVQSIHNLNLDVSEAISKELEHDIIQELKNKNISIEDTSVYTLKISSADSTKRRVATSVDAISDRYLMRFAITATLHKAKQRWPVNVYAERIFDDDTSTPNTKNREQELIMQELQQQALNLLSARLYNFKTQ